MILPPSSLLPSSSPGSENVPGQKRGREALKIPDAILRDPRSVRVSVCVCARTRACMLDNGRNPRAQGLDHWTAGGFPHVPVLRTKTRSSRTQGCQDQLKC